MAMRPATLWPCVLIVTESCTRGRDAVIYGKDEYYFNVWLEHSGCVEPPDRYTYMTLDRYAPRVLERMGYAPRNKGRRALQELWQVYDDPVKVATAIGTAISNKARKLSYAIAVLTRLKGEDAGPSDPGPKQHRGQPAAATQADAGSTISPQEIAEEDVCIIARRVRTHNFLNSCHPWVRLFWYEAIINATPVQRDIYVAGRRVHLERGELFLRTADLARAYDVDRKTVAKWLRRLVHENMIEVRVIPIKDTEDTFDGDASVVERRFSESETTSEWSRSAESQPDPVPGESTQVSKISKSLGLVVTIINYDKYQGRGYGHFPQRSTNIPRSTDEMDAAATDCGDNGSEPNTKWTYSSSCQEFHGQKFTWSASIAGLDAYLSTDTHKSNGKPTDTEDKIPHSDNETDGRASDCNDIRCSPNSNGNSWCDGPELTRETAKNAELCKTVQKPGGSLSEDPSLSFSPLRPSPPCPTPPFPAPPGLSLLPPQTPLSTLSNSPHPNSLHPNPPLPISPHIQIPPQLFNNNRPDRGGESPTPPNPPRAPGARGWEAGVGEGVGVDPLKAMGPAAPSRSPAGPKGPAAPSGSPAAQTAFPHMNTGDPGPDNGTGRGEADPEVSTARASAGKAVSTRRASTDVDCVKLERDPSRLTHEAMIEQWNDTREALPQILCNGRSTREKCTELLSYLNGKRYPREALDELIQRIKRAHKSHWAYLIPPMLSEYKINQLFAGVYDREFTKRPWHSRKGSREAAEGDE